MEKVIIQFRINPITGKVALVNTERGNRPRKKEAPMPYDDRPYVDSCQFCFGNEQMTPPAILEIPKGEWNIRFVDNKFPLLKGDKQGPDFIFGLNEIMGACGQHDVVIDHRSHGIRMHEMSQEHLTLLFATYQSRMAEIYKNQEIQLVQIFKNFGPGSGGSLLHTHSQIVGMPLVPHNIEAEIVNGQRYLRKTGRCIFCSLIDEARVFESQVYDSTEKLGRSQIQVGQFIIERSKYFVALIPFAPSHDYETWILPLQHRADYLDLSTEEIADLAWIFKRTMARLNAVIEGMQYNFFIHTLPHGEDYADSAAAFHMHLEIVPRITVETGFEKSTRIYVLEVDPAEAAKRLRNVPLEIKSEIQEEES
jgi:UDPglucose--hexose-1-phosphate uridylyltransferase